MAWIVWTKGFARKPEVLSIAEKTGRDRREVATTLMEFYEWADGESEDGLLRGLSVRTLCSFCAFTDALFWRAVIEVGWLVLHDEGLLIPHYERWMGRNAKRRLKNTNRMRRTRADETDGLCADCAVEKSTDCAPQNRTSSSSKKNTPPGPPRGGSRRGVEQNRRDYFARRFREQEQKEREG